MAERHKREAKLNRGRKAKNKGREVLPNTKKSTSTEVINQEHKEIIKWFQTVKFRRTLFGGVDENDVWKKLQELNQLYESAIRAERERYNILLTDHEKTYESLIYKYKQELMKMRARQSRLRWTIQKMKCHQKPEMRCGGDADCKKYELFQNNPQTKKRSRDQKWLHTATRKNHISNRMRRIIIHTGIFTYESAGQWNVPGNQRR